MRLRIMAFAGFLLLAMGGSTGCSKDHRVEIQSDTCWDGTINSQQNIVGCGNKNYKIIGELGCARIQKQSVNGYLRLRVDGGAWVETSEQFGLLQVCR